MTIKSSGSLSMAEINAEFGLGTNMNVYRGVQWWLDDNTTGNFTSTNLGFNQFYSKRKTSPVVPGSTTYSTAGSHMFTVPLHNNLTVQVWGGGGGGASAVNGARTAGANGGQSHWNNAVVGNGGGGAPASAGGSNGAGGSGGTASGGTTNTAGSNGGIGDITLGRPSGTGGASPNGGGTQEGVTYTGLPVNGLNGNAPGGGGSGGHYLQPGGGGGGGGYSSRSYSSGTFGVGTGVPVTVGSGGLGGVRSGAGSGGNGAVGRVVISWN